MKNPDKQLKLHKEIVSSLFTTSRTNSPMISAMDSRIPCTVPRFIASRLAPIALETPLHHDDAFEIFYLHSTSDSCSYIIENSKYRINPGELLFIPMGLNHCVRDSTKDTKGTIFDFTYEFAKDVAQERCFETFFDCAHIHPWFHGRDPSRLIFRPVAESRRSLDRTVDALKNTHDNMISAAMKKNAAEISKISKELHRNFANFMRIIRSTFYQSCTQEELQTFEKYRPPLLAAIDYMEANFSQQIKFADICAASGYKTAWFSKLFREIMHISPLEYLNFVRARHARSLLVNTDETILDIAKKCGYNSIQYFDRAFKQYTGCSPRIYRTEYIIEY